LVLTAEDTESLVAPVKSHFDETHGELGLSQTAIRNYLQAEDRATGSTRRMEEIGSVDIEPITPESAHEVGEFFDVDVFPDNPAWASCYCMFYFRGGRANADWGNETWEENRSELVTRIRKGTATGTLAYVDGKLAGWCNATERARFPGLGDGADEGVVSVVCFAIAPPYRRHGLATRLLEGAIAGCSDRGFARIEAYPVRDPADERAAFHGSLSLFEKFDFEVVSEEPLVVSLELE
jgi:GNAT superfamily N-acetyltransferase